MTTPDDPNLDRTADASLREIAARARVWLVEDCFPFWAERGPHPAGGFRERVALDGAPLNDAVSRVRVQARQTYVFARARLMGWEPDRAAALVETGVASLLGPCRREDGLVGKMVEVGRGLADPQPELYDNAFAMLALAWASRALARPDLLDEAKTIAAALAAGHAHPAGGYEETLPPRRPRRQNPHMHLFEASLAMAAAGDADALARADGLKALLEKHFYDPACGHLREFFDAELRPLEGEDGDVVEPGHELEWAALLDLHARQAGADLSDVARALYDAGLSALDAQGFAPMATRLDGSPRDASRRTWSQTEALRAHLAFARRGDLDAAARAERLARAIFTAHLDPAPAGAWIDHYDADGAPCVDAVTAATGYHLVTAFIELSETAQD